FSSRRRHTRSKRDWSSDVCSSDLVVAAGQGAGDGHHKDLVRPGVSRQEIPHVGAGGRAFAFISAQGVGHGKGVGAGVVHIFLLEIGRASCRARGKVWGWWGAWKGK